MAVSVEKGARRPPLPAAVVCPPGGRRRRRLAIRPGSVHYWIQYNCGTYSKLFGDGGGKKQMMAARAIARDACDALSDIRHCPEAVRDLGHQPGLQKPETWGSAGRSRMAEGQVSGGVAMLLAQTCRQPSCFHGQAVQAPFVFYSARRATVDAPAFPAVCAPAGAAARRAVPQDRSAGGCIQTHSHGACGQLGKTRTHAANGSRL